MYGIIYLVTNKINLKRYIGQTTMTLKARWQRHCSHANEPEPQGLHAAIKKYGKENFSIRQIEECATKELLNEREVFWIAYYNTFLGDGYNRTPGGEGAPKFLLPEEEIAARYQNGESYAVIAKDYGCTDKTIAAHVQAQGVQTRSRKGICTEQQKKNLEKGRIGGRAENFTAHIEKLKKKVGQFDAEGNLIAEYDSLSAACRALGKPTNHTNRLSNAAELGKFYWGYYWILH